jgi:hypothetical protein
MKLLILKISPASCYFHQGPDMLLGNLFSKTLNLSTSLRTKDQVSHPFKTIKVKIVFILIFMVSDRTQEYKKFRTEW